MSELIKRSFSILLYPFRIQTDWEKKMESLASDEVIWQKSFVRIKEKFLFKHVQDYFNYNAAISVENANQFDLSQAIIFELKDSLKSTRAHCSFEKLFTTALVLKTKGKDFPFKFNAGIKKTILSPKLIIIPQSGIGIISLSISLEEENMNLTDLITFNYACRTLYKSTKKSPILFPQSTELNEQRRAIFLEVNQNTFKEEANDLGFTFNQLIKFLIGDFEEQEVEAISPKHFQIFTFAQTKQRLQSTNLNDGIFRLSRVYNLNYFSPFKRIEENPEVIQTFRDVFVSITQEGGCILINSDESNPISFLDSFGENVMKTRYLWIYLLSYLQRITLINTSYLVSDLLKQNDYSIEVISHHIQMLSKIQIRSMFSEVSHITMHNAFYSLCRENFRIPQLFNELKNELFDLNMIVQQQIEQNQISKELDLKEKEKEEAKKQKIVVENQAKFEKRLNLVLFGIGVLTLLSVWKDFSDLMTNGLSKNELLSFVELLVVVVIMVFIISKVSNFYQKK